jgi:hypothetical protein
MKSLEKLKILENIKFVITSHSGYTENKNNAFSNTNQLPNWKDKNFKINDNAPYNPYE